MENLISAITAPAYTILVYLLGYLIGLPGDKTKTAQYFGAVLVLAVVVNCAYPLIK